MKRLLLALLVGLLILGSLGFGALARSNVASLIICSEGLGTHYLPASACETYLLELRGGAEDVADLNARGGLNFLVSVGDKQLRRRYMEFFIARGVDPNRISPVDNLAPLHAAVLHNEPDLVRYLLKQGASLEVQERNLGLTPLEFARHLQQKGDPAVERGQVVQLLEEAVRASA